MSKQCKCEHWQQCPVCMPHRFDKNGHLLPPEPTPLQAARIRIEELERERDALQADNAELVAALEKQVAHDKAISYERCSDCDYGQKCSRESGCQDIKNHSPIANTALAKVRKP